MQQKSSLPTYESSLAGFAQGINPIQGVLVARAADAQSRALAEESDHVITSSLAALAFGRGTIRQPDLVRGFWDVETRLSNNRKPANG